MGEPVSGTKELGPELMPFKRPATSKPEAPENPSTVVAASDGTPEPAPEGRMQLDAWRRPTSDSASRLDSYQQPLSDGTPRVDTFKRPSSDVGPREVSPGNSPAAPRGPTPETDGSIRIPVEVQQGGRTVFVLVRLSKDDQNRLGYAPAKPPAPLDFQESPGPRSILDLPVPRLPDGRRILNVSGGDDPPPAPSNQPASPPPSNQPASPAPSNQPASPAPSNQPASPPPSNQPAPPPPSNQPAPPPPSNQPADPPAPSPEELDARAKVVRKEAEGLWREIQRDGAPPTNSVRKIERNLRDVNNRDGVARKAAGQVMANLDLEKAKVAKLAPDQQLRYQGLVDATRHDPDARLALQVLLNDGKLTAGPRSKTGKDLLGELTAVAGNPVAAGLDATEVLSNVLQDVATPGAISQQNRATCSVATLQILTACHDPAEYVRLVGGLASPKGAVDLRDGSTLRRLRGTEYDDGTNRSDSSRLWQPALMDFAKGGTGSYSNYQDVFADTGDRGLGSQDISTAIDALAGTHAERLETHAVSPAEKEKQFTKILVNANSGKPVPVAIVWGTIDPLSGRTDGLHEVLVTGADKDRVFYTNPWGMEESMTRSEFKSRLHWAHLPN